MTSVLISGPQCPNLRAWVAGALIGLIAILGRPDPAAPRQIGVTGHHVSVSGDVMLGERIAVFDFAKYQKCERSICEAGQFGFRELPRSRLREVSLESSGTQGSVIRKSEFLFEQIAPDGRPFQSNTIGDPDIIRGSLSPVLVLDGELSNIQEVANANLGHMDIGSQLSFGVLVGTSYEGLGSIPQKDRGESKDCCSGRKDQRSEGDPELFVTGKKAVKAGEPLWPTVAAVIFFLATPVIGVLLSLWRPWLGCSALGIWLLGVLGVTWMVGLG